MTDGGDTILPALLVSSRLMGHDGRSSAMNALIGQLPLALLFGWLGIATSLVLDLAIGMALAVVISATFRLANGA
jgi:hypothetical protein